MLRPPPPTDLVQVWQAFNTLAGVAVWWLVAGYILVLVGLMGLRRDGEILDPAAVRRH